MFDVICLLTKASSLLERLLWRVPVSDTHVLSRRTHRQSWYKTFQPTITTSLEDNRRTTPGPGKVTPHYDIICACHVHVRTCTYMYVYRIICTYMSCQ